MQEEQYVCVVPKSGNKGKNIKIKQHEKIGGLTLKWSKNIRYLLQSYKNWDQIYCEEAKEMAFIQTKCVQNVILKMCAFIH